jgi:hypothetical protein
MPAFSHEQSFRIPRSHDGTRTTITPEGRQVIPAPGYFINDNNEFEIEVVGYSIRVTHFARVVGGIYVSTRRPALLAYQLMYSYRESETVTLSHTVFFLGGRPCLHFLCEDPRQNFQGPIVDYRLTERRNGRLLLRVSHPDATVDTSREPFGADRTVFEPDIFVDCLTRRRYPSTASSSSSSDSNSDSDYMVQAFNSDMED